MDTVVRNITTTAEFETLREDWLRLYQNSETAGLFNSWDWNRLWWQHYGDMCELFIIVVSVDGVVQGIGPFYRCKTKALKLCTVQTLRFIGSGGDTSPDDMDLLFGKEFRSLVIGHVCESIFKHSQCTRLQLNDVIANSELVKVLLSTATEHRWASPVTRQLDRRVDSLPETIEQFEKNLSKNARKQRKRRRQLLCAAGEEVRYDRCTKPGDLEDTFSELLRIHNLRHATKGGSESFQSSRYRQFHRAVMEKALISNELRLMKLTIDGTTVGIEYAFLCKGTLSFFQTGFDPAFKHLSPGHLLMMETIDRAIEDGARCIDLLKGDYAYKHTYAKQIRSTVNIDLWRYPAINVILRLVRFFNGAQSC